MWLLHLRTELTLVALLVGLAAGTASAVELRDAELVAAGSPVLQNGAGTVRREDARLERTGPAIVVPEPSTFWQLASGVGLLALLAGRRRARSRAAWLAVPVTVWLAAAAGAQVPQDTTFTGRLVDDLGDPLAGPVNLELRIFDAATAGTQLYGEQHLLVPLDATGGFSVQLGLGASPSGTFDADLFSDVDRWLEVVVDSEVLTPRQIIGSVPWAFVAERANELVRDPNAPRFEDCGDGTVADHQTGLRWEQKTGTSGTPIVCATTGCPDPHDVNNGYHWSSTGSAADGDAFTDFLAKLDDPVFGEAVTATDVTGCFAAHCDWRLPTVVELQTIVDCVHPSCIDPIFGPTESSFYYTASTTSNPSAAWTVRFLNGVANDGGSKALTRYVRAVRVGSCQ